MDTVGRILEHADEHHINAEDIYIDDTGLGGGVTDRLCEQGHIVTPVIFGSSADEKERFSNKRTELYWRMRAALKPDAVEPLYIPKEFKDVAKETTWARYKPKSDRVIQLEPKEAIKKRHKRSPDLADALALTFEDAYNQFNVGAA